MEEQQIVFKTSNLAEKAGYPFECVSFGTIENVPLNIPTQSLLQKWLREKHKIFVTVVYFSRNANLEIMDMYHPIIDKMLPNHIEMDEVVAEEFPTYEEALEEGLQEALKLIE